ncbi:hypothetical protein PAHAL_9G387200 [Panicum hallii]|uniref:Fe2OG dioxygenase domain-containing protein n=1 Tax=Panicum hallii TaxID=206008 RepID=A0A2T8I3Z6_9POAL|nr:hypothetical protein PAHAL_9G387200 [Panicum hallii]
MARSLLCQIEKQKLDWADMFYLVAWLNEARDLRFWPAHPPSFRTSIDRYPSPPRRRRKWHAACWSSSWPRTWELIRHHCMLQMFQGQPQGLRMNHYPPCRQANRVLGMSPHTDAAGLTLLLQVNDMPGLQIRRDGKWFAVDALDGALVLIVGDILEVMDNDKC